MRARFVISEIWIGLRRNLTMTIAVIVSVAVSLTLAGAAMLLNSQVAQMRGYWDGKVEVSIFFCNKQDAADSGTSADDANCTSGQATQAQIDAVDQRLLKNPLVARIYAENQQQAFANYKQQFQGSPYSPYVSAADLDDSLRVKLTDPQKYDLIAGQVDGLPGVKEVNDQGAVLKPLFNLLDGAEVTALVIMSIMLGVTLLLIVNTVRLSAFSRKRETGIMRLVGASDFSVQVPFVAEAAFSAVAGAVLACGLLAIGKFLMVDEFLRKQITLIDFIGWGSVLQVMPLLVAIGVGMSSLAAFLTLRRYLRV